MTDVRSSRSPKADESLFLHCWSIRAWLMKHHIHTSKQSQFTCAADCSMRRIGDTFIGKGLAYLFTCRLLLGA